MKTDLEIIKEIQDDKLESYKVLLERYENGVMSVLNNRLPHSAVEDVAQDVFIRTFRSLDKYRAAAPFEHWIKKIALRCCYDYWRKTYRINEHNVSSLSDDQQSWIDSCGADMAHDQVEKLAARTEARELLLLVMERLKPLDRALIDMIYLNDMTMNDTAEALGSNTMLIKVRASRARKKMRKVIEELVNSGKV